MTTMFCKKNSPTFLLFGEFLYLPREILTPLLAALSDFHFVFDSFKIFFNTSIEPLSKINLTLVCAGIISSIASRFIAENFFSVAAIT